MPVSVAVCESTANAVNAALRDSLGATTGNGGVGKAAAASVLNGDSHDDGSIHNNIVANAKRILLTKIEYEEVENYSDSVLEKFKSKCIVIKPDEPIPYHNQHNSTCSIGNRNNNTNGHDCSTTDINGNGSVSRSSSKSPAPNSKQQLQAKQQQQQTQSNPNELPAPKRVLFARENVRIGWKHGFNGRKWNVGVGMMNVGNTCYLNSTLQALFHVPAMANWLLSDSAHMERCDTADAGCIICAMAKTLQSSQTNQSAIRPYMVYSKLKAICKHMVMGRQEDAHEFLRFLVESMEKSYLTRFRNFKELDQYSKETTPLNQILGGYLKSAVRCLSCGHVSVTFQHFQDLLLDIRKADTIDEALEGYFSRERLEDTGYKCEACKKKVSATKQFSLERAPIVLCIQLKRFSIVGTKLNKQMTLKPRLDLTKFTSRKTQGEHLTYKLVAMVTHLGVSQHCGHYTAIGLTESGTYYNYDDSYVRPISVQSVCNTSAYIIFYEMDNTNSYRTLSPASSTQVSGINIADAHINSPKVMNGVRITNGHLVNQQRIIGPQLPPGGLPNRHINNKSPSPGQTPKQLLQKQANGQVTPNGNNKITIHFKNGHASLVKNSSSIIPSTVVGASVAQNNNSHNKQQNGLLTGTSKFQESSHTKCTLAGTSNKGQTVAITNGNKSSSNNAYAPVTSSSEDEDADGDDVGGKKITSTTQNTQRKLINAATTAASSSSMSTTNSVSTLPSMPKLFDNCMSNGKITLNGSGNSNNTNNKSTGIKQQQQLRSLVPYESASDDDDFPTSNSIHNTTTDIHANNRHDNPLKRHSNDSSSSMSSDKEINEVQEGPAQKRHITNNVANNKIAKKPANNNFRVYNTASPALVIAPSRVNNNNNNTNSNKQKTDAIDEIFKAHNSNNKRNGIINNNNSNLSTRKQKSNQLQANSKATIALKTDSDNSDNETAAKNDSNTYDTDTTFLGPYKRAKSTPPSPPVIKSKVGLWQVTQNDPDTTNTKSIASVTSKNLKNPFASKVSESATTMKRAKVVNGKQHEKRIGNGYQQDVASDGAVNELLKQSHRGYGAPVLTWNGTQTDIEKEIIAEAREQRQRDWEHDENNEQDQGRQRKVKSNKESATIHNRTPGYNPFQEHENQKRWHKGGTGSFYQRFHHTGSHFRHNFHQRSKFKFNRSGGSKFQQRALHRHVAMNGLNRRQDT